jgi:TonB family protein
MNRAHIMNCHSTTIRLRSQLFLLIVASLASLFTGNIQELGARTLSRPSSSVHASAEWDRYASKDGDFSVLLPTVPAMNSYRFTSWSPFSNSRRYLRTLIGAYSQGVGYAIEIFEVRQSLDEFISESRNLSGGELKEVSVSGTRGKEFAFENDTTKLVTRYFIRGSRIYVFRAHGSRLGNPDVGIPKFLESIKFARPLAGREIVDGPGIQDSTDPTPETDVQGARILSGKEVTTKAIVITKPEPRYTEEARKNAITGTVVLRCVFSSSGVVTNRRVVYGLPYGLTENAVAAAEQIRFIPASKDGRFVSMYIQLEYNFNLY